MYDLDSISLPPNPRVPLGFKEENWHANGNIEIAHYANDVVPFNKTVFGFNTPVNNQTMKELRLACVICRIPYHPVVMSAKLFDC